MTRTHSSVTNTNGPASAPAQGTTASAAQPHAVPSASTSGASGSSGNLPPRPRRTPLDPPWTVEDAAEHFQIGGWGQGFFGINKAGHVVVRPKRSADVEIDMFEIVCELRERGLQAPIILGFADVLNERINDLHDAFARAIRENEYKGGYCAVYPIKVNQQRHLVEEVNACNKKFGFGLEVGSKPELLAVLGMTTGENDSRPIICNGFKEERYIEHVMLAAKLGRTIFPVIENLSELRLIVDLSQRYGVKPRIGVRMNTNAQGAGRWKHSSGAKAKFGLSVSEVLEVVQYLRERKMLDCLQLLHCHLGSQIHDIRSINAGAHELARIYVELVRMGAGLQYLDVGGGLGVDYDGSQTNFEFSTNYTLAEYASNIIYRVASVCDESSVAHPTIITESGRAMVAHHSVLIFNVLGSTGVDRVSIERELELLGGKNGLEASDDIPRPMIDLHEAYRGVSERRLLECYHDALEARDAAMNLFNVGHLTLEQRGQIERMFWATCAKIRDKCREMTSVPEELEDLESSLSDVYFINLSVFQSLPDIWAINQIFPIMPIHRLDQRPTRAATLADITCDSDGKIDRFADKRDIKRVLMLHPHEEGSEYYLAAFLVGAYQETLGDLHNLFGDTHVVHIKVDENGQWWIDQIVEGDSVREVLSYTQYEVSKLFQEVRKECETAVRRKRMSVAESQQLLRAYEAGLAGYTYLE